MTTIPAPKTIVLKKQLDEESAEYLVDKEKRNIFKSFLKKPKKDEIHVHSLKLFYEAFLLISGKYEADFYRKATHSINVPYNVKEVVLGDGVFPINKKSDFHKLLSTKRSKNKVLIELEEHVFIKEEDSLSFDHHGKEIHFPFKVDSKTIENYPSRLLKKFEGNVKKPEITYDAIINKLTDHLKKPLESDVRDLNYKLTIKEISEVYIPIYEARLVGPKKKVGILRIDAVRNKIL